MPGEKSELTDGEILLELTKIRSKYKFQEHSLEDRMTMVIGNVNYNTWVKIRRLIKKLNIGIVMTPNGDLDTVNLISHPRQYKITLEKAFKILEENYKPIGCSLTFMPKKRKWMNK